MYQRFLAAAAAAAAAAESIVAVFSCGFAAVRRLGLSPTCQRHFHRGDICPCQNDEDFHAGAGAAAAAAAAVNGGWCR